MKDIVEKYGSTLMEVIGALLIIAIVSAVFFGGALAQYIMSITGSAM